MSKEFKVFFKPERVEAQTLQPRPIERALASQNFTLGDVSFGIGLFVTVLGLIGGIVNLSLRASKFKNDLELMDIKLSQRVDTFEAIVSQKLENIDASVNQKSDALRATMSSGFEHLRAEIMQQRVRINWNAGKIRNVEFFLGKWEYVPRNDNDDSM